MASTGSIDPRRADLALADLTDLRLDRVPHLGLLPRCWALRPNLSVYDAAYVALAELMDATLLTADAKLAHAPGPQCPIDLLT